MRLTIFTLAHDLHYTEPGKLLNLTGIYTGIAAPSFPFTVPRLLLVARFTGSPAEYGREFEVMVGFVDQDGLPAGIAADQKRLTMMTGQSGEDVHCVYTLEAFNVTFHQPGWYQFNIHVDDKQIDELPVNVAQAVRR